MPIRKELRDLYPDNWEEISAEVRERARWRCEHCDRPHLEHVWVLPDGRWLDQQAGFWRDGAGRPVPGLHDNERRLLKLTYVVLSAAHLDHDPGNIAYDNLAALCQRCHMLHDRAEHHRRRRLTLLKYKAYGDLFEGPYPLIPQQA